MNVRKSCYTTLGVDVGVGGVSKIFKSYLALYRLLAILSAIGIKLFDGQGLAFLYTGRPFVTTSLHVAPQDSSISDCSRVQVLCFAKDAICQFCC